MSEFPPDWGEHLLGDIAEVINGRAYKLSEWEEVGTPVIRLQNLTQGGGSFYYSSLTLPEKQYCRKGDLLYMWSASFGPHIWWGKKAIFHYHIWKIEPRPRLVDKKYLYYLLDAKTQDWKSTGSGMAMIHLTKTGFEKEILVLPPLPEQKKIAEILSGIDNHIEGIKKQIAALVLLRSSILEQSLKRFADCPVRPLHEITERITVGIVSKPADHYVSKGVPTFRSMNIKEGRIDYRDIRFISKESNEAFKKSMIKKGDILTVRTGAPGTSAVAPADLEGANCVDIILSTPAPGIDSFFLCLQINSASIKSKVFTAQGGLAQQHFNVGEMRDLEVLVPPLEIQRDISCSVNSVNAYIDSKDRHKVKLEELKRAMSDDLLSGRKRVTL